MKGDSSKLQSAAQVAKDTTKLLDQLHDSTMVAERKRVGAAYALGNAAAAGESLSKRCLFLNKIVTGLIDACVGCLVR